VNLCNVPPDVLPTQGFHADLTITGHVEVSESVLNELDSEPPKGNTADRVYRNEEVKDKPVDGRQPIYGYHMIEYRMEMDRGVEP
jgi:hypothetical protein